MKHIAYFSAAVAGLLAATRHSSPIAVESLDFPTYTLSGGYNRIPYGSSKWSVAKDKRRAMKRKAVKRARRLGHA